MESVPRHISRVPITLFGSAVSTEVHWISLKQKLVVLSVVIAVIVAAALISVLVYSNFQDGTSASTTTSLNCSTISKITRVQGSASSNPKDSVATFLVVEADPGSPFEGMNGSAYHIGVPWPVINVYRNQTVVIHVFNCASSEPHGFAVTHYFNSGVTLPTGGSYTLTFAANQAGTFIMYCSTFCAIHPYMQDGEIIVS